MVYVKYMIREMFQKTYVIPDFNENRLVIRDRLPPPPPPLYHPENNELQKSKLEIIKA